MSPRHGELAALVRSLQSTSDSVLFRDWAADRLVDVALDSHDPASLHDIVSTVLDEVEEGRKVLQRLFEELRGPKGGDHLAERFSESWWAWKEGLIQMFAMESETETACSLWLRTYASALLNGQTSGLERLAKCPLDLPVEGSSSDSGLVTAVRAVRENGDESAISHLIQAISGEPPEQVLDEETRAALLLLQGRVHLYQLEQSEIAIQLFLQADRLAPGRGGPKAAMGDYFRILGDSEPSATAMSHLRSCGGPIGDEDLRSRNRSAAKFLYQRAVALSPESPAGWVGLGRCLEEGELWDEADDHYAEAIRLARTGGGTGSLGVLLDSVGSGFYLQLSRMLRREGDETGALDAVNQALDGDPAPFVLRIGLRLRAEILDSMNRPEEAAESYYRAGSEFLQSGDARVAVDLLQRAMEREPSHLSTHWTLADALRIASYRPPPENVDESVLAESLNTWYGGATLRLPGREDAWAWAVLAGIHEQRARLPDSDSWELGWAGALCLERALALQPQDVDRLNGLGRAYRALRLPATALQAFDLALEIWPGHPLVIDEKIITLVNNGYLDEAKAALEERAEGHALADWHSAAESFVLARQGAFTEALDLIRSAIEDMDEEVLWMVELRGLCHRALGQREEAEADYRWIRDRGDPRDRENGILFGWAAYQLGEYDDAMKSFAAAADRRLEAHLALRNLGLCHLQRGDLDLAREAFDSAIPGMNSLELYDLVTFELPEFEAKADPESDRRAFRDFIAELRTRIEDRRTELEVPPSAKDELAEVLAGLELEGMVGSPPWVAARAGLARVHSAANRWAEAAPIYRELLEDVPDQFPEAVQAVEAGVERIESQAEAEFENGDPEAAAHILLDALEMVRGLSLWRVEARLHVRAGLAALLTGDVSASLHHRSEARHLFESAGVEDPDREAALVYRNLLRDPADYWMLAAELERDGVDVEGSGLSRALDDFFRLRASPRSPLMVTPISVELAADLIPEDTGSDWSLLKHHVPQMRERIEKELGIVLPGVNFRGYHVDLPSGAYIIMLEEVPLVLGTVQPAMHFAAAPRESLEAFGVPSDQIRPANHPVTDLPGSWVAPRFDKKLRGRGVGVWTDPLLYMVHHVERILRANLDVFLGLHETQSILDRWSGQDDGARRVKEAIPSPDHRLRFARLLRALVREGVPITTGEDILDTWIQHDLGAAAPDTALRMVRLALRRQLPGNQPGVVVVALPTESEERVLPWLREQNGRWFLAARPHEVQEFLATLRDILARPPRDRDVRIEEGQALVVARDDLRAPLRRLTELEFPRVHLLSREEVIHD